MKSAQLTAFVEAIRSSGLLASEQVEWIATAADGQGADPQAIAQEIVKRGWLTIFQVKMFWKGKGSELFLNQYVLIDRIGEGGMGEVYKAHHRKMERDVALKVIRKEKLANADSVKRFHREIRAAAQLTHENVVMAYDADQSGDRHFFVMEYVEGLNLARLVKEKGVLPIKDACEYIRQAALGLQHAHEKGMVHRDVKPSNLLLCKSTIKILDMGLARIQDSTTGQDQSRLTTEGLVIGTPDFVAPEQARNSHSADIRADIYALGGTLYYLLVGRSPYPTGTATEKMIKHATDPIPSVDRPDMLPEIERIIQRMLAKKPQDRYQTPTEVAAALEPYCGLSVSFSAAHVQTIPIRSKTTQLSRIAVTVDADPSTDSHFRLPPPSTNTKSKTQANPQRWFGLIALGAGVVILGLLALAIYALSRSKSTSGPDYASEMKLTLPGSIPMNLVLIRAGSFAMGSPDSEEGHQADEGPVHNVELTKPFYMGSTEVTIRQYQAVLGRLPRSVTEGLPKDEQVVPESELDQAATVTENEADAFIAKLNKDDRSGCKPGWEFRLPTEAEWEYACRADTRGRFFFGNELTPGKAIYGEAERHRPSQVGQRSANDWGLYDMHGNVAEWCLDRYDDKFYSESPAKDPIGGEKRSRFVVRGGAWNSSMLDCRSAKRRAEFPEKPAVANVGFRIVMVQVSSQ